MPHISDTFARSLAKYRAWNFAAFHGWMPDGKGMVVISRVGEMNQLHVVSAPKAALRRLTSSPEPVIDVSVCPDPAGRSFLFTRDSGGDENFQIYRQSFDSSGAVMLTQGKWQNEGMVWSNAGDQFAFSSNKRNGTDFDICVTDIRQPRNNSTVLSATGSWAVVGWSPNDSLLLVSHYISRTASFLYVCNWRTGQSFPLHDTTDTVSQESGAWGPKGRGLFLTSDQGTDVRALRYYDLASHRETVLTASIPWDVREIEISRNRQKLVFHTNENGYSHIYIMNTSTFAWREVPGLPLGGIYGLRFDPTGENLGMTITTAQHPEEAYSLNLSDFSLTRWTFSDMGGLDSNAFVSPTLVHYPTFDTMLGMPRTIPCFIYMPKSKRGPFPVLIDVHGGPESQFWPYFKPDLQYDANELGLCVIAPNIRGSGGYGKSFLSLDNRYKRENAVKDIGCLLSWVSSQKDLDTSRVGISGGSYGGYVSLASLVRFGGKLRAGIDMYGICNFVTFLERTSTYRRDLRRIEYGDERDLAMRAFLSRISPLTHAASIRCPLFILQGANDPRVPQYESDQIADAVRGHGGTVWEIVAADEGHGFRKKSNEDFQECAQAFFLKTFLSGKRE